MILDPEEETSEEIETSDVDEVTQLSAKIQNTNTKLTLAEISISKKIELNGDINMTIWYNTTGTENFRRRRLEDSFPDTINGYDVKDKKCSLTLTPFGDMSSFIGHPENMEESFFFNATSTGYINIED